jgi:hypothetical protein
MDFFFVDLAQKQAVFLGTSKSRSRFWIFARIVMHGKVCEGQSVLTHVALQGYRRSSQKSKIDKKE